MRSVDGATRRALILTVIAVGCASTAACSRRVMSVLFDLPPEVATAPPPTLASPPVAEPGQEVMRPMPAMAIEDTIVPPIERTLDPDSVLAMLPRDHAGNVDWVAALREDVIRPRNGIGGPRSNPPGAFQFKFDFFFPGPNETFDAYFPHSVHTEVIDCAQCHPRIFKRRGTEVTMASVFQGQFCGECHGKVAFNPVTACERCHTAVAMPPDRAKPELTGTVQMKRATEIVAPGDSAATVAGNADGVRTSSFPVARFPHWVHRIRYRCSTCHMEIFEPRAGTNAITMKDIGEGRACGRCHDGLTAFVPSMGNCDRCHVPPTQAVADGPSEAPGS